MPFLRLTVHPDPSTEIAHTLAGELTGLMADILNKKADLTSVLVEGSTGTGTGTSTSTWTIGRAAQDRACHLEVTITAGTNTTEQKADFIRAAMGVLKARLGPLHPATYVALREVAATDWGYEGLNPGGAPVADCSRSPVRQSVSGFGGIIKACARQARPALEAQKSEAFSDSEVARDCLITSGRL